MFILQDSQLPKSKGYLTIEYDHEYFIGKGVDVKNARNKAYKQVANKLKKSELFLVKDFNQTNGYKIITGYPIF